MSTTTAFLTLAARRDVRDTVPGGPHVDKPLSLVFLFILLLVAVSAQAATRYVTPAGAGARTGVDWANAYAGLPATLVRGDTYVMAGGTYGSHRFSDPLSGTTPIRIRKAQGGTYNGVAYNDDTVAGWNPAFQTNQAVITSASSTQWTFTTGFYDVDGITPSAPWATSGYGFKIMPAANSQNNYLLEAARATNMRIQHIEFANAGQSFNFEQFNLILWRADNSYVAYNYFYAAQNHVRLAGSQHCIIEYNNIGPTSYFTNHHGENINMLAENYSSGVNPADTTIRYNWFANTAYSDTTGQIIDLTNPGQTNDGVYIYGNVFVDLPGHNGIGSGNSGSPGALTNWKLYNNTFINSIVNLSRLSTGSELVNNLFFGSETSVFAGSAPSVRKNNYWNSSSNGLGSGTSDVTSTESTSVLFANYAGSDYRLKSGARAQNAGSALSSPYNKDADGRTRGADGSFDIGAYEFSGSGTDTQAPTVPTNMAASAASSSQINLTWTASTDPSTSAGPGSGVAGYKIFRCTGAGCSPTTEIATVTSGTSYQNTGLTASTTYRYAVAAYDAAGNVSAASAAAGASTQAAPSGACTQTISVGANIAAAVSSAANGSTICLNSGNYGAVNLWDINRSGFVTLQSASGVGAAMSPSVGNSKYLKFVNMTLSNMLVNNCSLHIHVLNSTFAPNAGGLAISNHGYNCAAGDQDYLIDGVAFDKAGQAGYEGRLSLSATDGAIVKNSVFSGVSTSNMTSGPSDGIQLIGGAKNTTIGPNNVFTGILESLCGSVHCDAIQLYGAGANNTVTGNYFANGDTFIMAPDGTTGVTVTNNVFDGAGVSYIDKIQFGSAAGPVFRHNSLRNVRVSFDSKTGSPASSNVSAQNNLLMSNSAWKTSGGSGCSSCLFSFNLYDNSANAGGTNNVIGSPIFIQGSNPTTWAGWQLAAASPGYRAGNDGLDMGTNYYGAGALPADTQPPSAPGSLTAAAVSSSQINLAWTASTDDIGVAGYKILRCAGSSCTPGTLVATVTSGTSHQDTGLTASTTYRYTVAAYDAAGNVSAQSAAVSTTTAAGTPPASGQTLLTTQIPASTGSTDGAGVNYELGLRFQSNVAGQITAIRFWKSASETGAHTGRIWSAAGTQLASVVFANETASGWQQQTLASPLTIQANTEYLVSFNTGNSYYVSTTNGLAGQIVSGNLSSVVGGNGRYGPVGQYPTQTFQSTNYFRDIVFNPSGGGTSRCDVDASGTTDVVDVQLAVNQALGGTCTADINGDGRCDVIDVQRVVNAALGGQCASP